MTVGITELPPEGMQLGGVALAGDAERGTKTTEGLSLLFTAAGITVQGPQPQIERLLVWSGLDSATCREKVTLPDGRSAAVMELTSGGQSIRFLFPTESVTPGQAAYLDQALPHWLARYKGAPAAPAPTPAPAPAPGGPVGSDQAPAGGNGAGTSVGTSTPPPPPATGAPTAGVAAAGAAVGASALIQSGPEAAATPPAPPRSAPPAAGPAPSGPPPAPPGWANAGSVATPPPPPPPGGVAGYAAPPPATTPPPPRPLSVGTPGWESAPAASGPGGSAPAGSAPGGSAPGGTAWDTPPSSSGPDFSAPMPVKKTRRRRKGSDAEATAAGAVAAPAASAAFSPSPAPSEAPSDPVPLQGSTLPPPPSTDAGPAVWKPPVDPVTGETLWDGQPAPDAPAQPEEKGLRRGLGRRRAAKAAAAGAVVGTAAGVGAEAMAAPVTAPPPPPPTGAPSPSSSPSDISSPFFTGSGPAPFGAEADPPPPWAPGDTTTDGSPPAKKSRTTLILLVVLVLVVVGGVAYFLTKKSNSSTTTAPTVAPAPAPATGDTALAASINLRLADLPTGWAAATGGPVRPPAAPAAAQTQATRGLAECLGVPVATAAGLFATTPIPGQTGSATSPTFADGSDPTIRMFSTTRVMANTAGAQSLAAPFADSSFLTCFGEYQSVLASAATPGATAQVQVVGLAAPTGVQAYGYLTTITIPNQGTDIVGEAFLFGGRIESKLEPTTAGAQVPTSAFTPALNAMESRIAAAVDK